MLISPPFLPGFIEGESENTWLARAMVAPTANAPGTGAPEGSFPVSTGLQWHTGIHWIAPQAGGTEPSVRAIADGLVIFASPPSTHSADPAHPQNYRAWSDNGCVIVRHSTDIGAVGGVPTTVTYYSLSMHLSHIADNPHPRTGDADNSTGPRLPPRPWRKGDRIYRKEVIGSAGRCYGDGRTLHFEICCDEASLTRLIGRAPTWVETEPFPTPRANGRSDALFGEVWIHLPSTTPTRATAPTSHLRTAADPAQRPLDVVLWVAIRYDLGLGAVRTLDTSGRQLGDTLSEQDFEYDLYKIACDRHADYVASGGTKPSSPSGWYELLRFGRNLGPDPLPNDAAHWRQIRTPNGTLWADLNTENTFKFSEADFLPVMGWNCFGDDTKPLDQRCDSIELKRVIRDPDPHNQQRMERDRITARLGRPDIRARLRKAICRFPTEWDRATIETRFQWIRDPNELPGIHDDDAWQRFTRHCTAMSFNDLPDEYKKATWRFHPGEFIEVMRRCGWLNKLEITQTIPLGKGKTHESLSTVLEHHLVNSHGQTMRPGMIYPAISIAMRKYGINQLTRTAHWFAQILQETGNFVSMREFGDSSYLKNYYEGRCKTPVQRSIKGEMRTLSPLGNCAPGDGVRFSGKGLIQLTGGDNYRSYQAYRGHGDFTTESNSEKLVTDAHHACEAGGVYWAGKQRYTLTNKVLKPFGKLGMNYWADKNAFKYLPNAQHLETAMKEVTKGINSGLEHLKERTEKFEHALKYFSDSDS